MTRLTSLLLCGMLLLLAGCSVVHHALDWQIGKPCYERQSQIREVCGAFGMTGPSAHFERWGSDLVCVESYEAKARAVSVPQTVVLKCDGDRVP